MFSNKNAVPLSFIKHQATFHVQKVVGSPDVKQHLHEIGFCEGASGELISCVGNDVVVCLKDTNLALSAGLALKIYVVTD